MVKLMYSIRHLPKYAYWHPISMRLQMKQGLVRLMSKPRPHSAQLNPIKKIKINRDLDYAWIAQFAYGLYSNQIWVSLSLIAHLPSLD